MIKRQINYNQTHLKGICQASGKSPSTKHVNKLFSFFGIQLIANSFLQKESS